ncbi:TRAP transporter small permease [Shimwellia blattae]|uniref:TRAP transporter small permease protein n=1 Tax=Shimwellia blattae (strain ATCC 29907 / DSM 4481 / JCM 1650 / NBRC 105725 / CDC 9005-74) TaxID=630626 RepID=I2BD99_SHIBC|nr:TRAP transporter small permease [Shimwellia blattae]AFJ48503.1 putative tripartite ATP-independent periplasmic transporter [Shimwellia blattae DSM 4481 = NBRC 105725]GAB83097.1 putative transporter [Shimwellia blattae DSM 4481 = NBRC 105725]VDY65995.1 Neu5Ac permease [Shimwellia blattae]VEC26573.1 Neu5Ac permease [Shimwellia blattae]
MYRLFQRAELALARCGLAAMVVIILAGGLGRSVGYPLIWSLEVAMVVFAWVAVLAIDYALQIRRHIGVDALFRLLPPAIRRSVNWFSELLILAFLGCGVWFGYGFTVAAAGSQLPVTGLSTAWLNSAVPTGCLLMFINTALYIGAGCPAPAEEAAP